MIDGFQLGPLYIRFYGIILMLGAVAGGWMATREAKRRGYDPEIVWDLLIYLIIGGVIGARLWHIFTPPPSSIAQGITTEYYLTHPLDALAIWHGGLGIPGAVIGGGIALFFYTRKYKLNFAEWTDIAAPGLALGQAIGRWGNFFNQELYGAPTNLPWKLYIDPQHRLAGFENVAYYHPLFAYESILDLLNMVLLLWVARNYESKRKNGDVFLVYLIVYPIIRFSLDFLRLDASRIAGINANQTLVAIVAILAVALLSWRHRKPNETAEAAAPSLDPEPVSVEVAEEPAPKKTTRTKSTTKKASTKKVKEE
ncbi:MAG TPA: prolipoprotein diacylglyceryl transferase [Anaerolineales bacterium]|nr:prolipoprotein diacylglyceryl transferase [Anaerolineales bacterium]